MFIELSSRTDGSKIVLNTDHIVTVTDDDETALVRVSLGTTYSEVWVMETYEEVRGKLGAQ